MNALYPIAPSRAHGAPLAAALALAAAAAFPYVASAAGGRPAPETEFRSPPPATRPLTWWHWLNGNITREGITRDLEAMARVGLGGCYMFNCGGAWPTGSVKFLSADWLGMVDHALREADRLGLKFGVHNCDGFSEAGGPWITPETSMKMLVWTSAEVKGPAPVDLTLLQPETREGFYRDIAVVAFPLPAGGMLSPSRMSGADPAQLANLSDGDPSTYAKFPPLAAGHRLEFVFDAPQVVRSLQAAGCGPHRWEDDTPFVLEVSDNGKEFRPVGSFTVNWDYQRGDVATAAFDDATGRVFRVTFTNAWPIQIGELTLSDAARVHFAEAKAGRLRSRGHGAEARHHRAYPGPSVDRFVPASHLVPAALVTNLTGRMSADGRLSWTPPPGRWRIVRIGYTSNGHYVGPATPEGRGLECDKLDAEVVRYHLEQYVGRLVKLAGPRAGRVLAAMEIDSWECGIQNWTAGFERRFRERMGYDLSTFWPALLEGWIVDSPDATERVLWDWRRFLADEFGRNFFRVASEFARDHGLVYVAESTGRQPYLYDVAWHRHSGVPMGEFWLGTDPSQGVRVDNKVASSLAHISGKPIVASESFTASPADARWQNHPFWLKSLGDRAFCAGVNQFVFHTFAHQPYEAVGPGFTFFHWGLNFNRGNTWWDDATPWMDYLSRCQFMLRQGRFVADVLAWVGEDVPNRIAWREELTPPLPDGFDFDGTDTQAVLDARVENRWIVLPSGARYRVLLLPPLPTMRPVVAGHVRRLLENGAVVVAPRSPLRSPSFRDRGNGDAQVRASLGALWESAGAEVDRRVGRGRLLSGVSFGEVFTRLGVPPDFAWHSERPDASIGWVHRRVDAWGADVYFVCNAMNREETIEAVIRDAAGEPELWDPADGTIRRCGVYRRERDGRCALTLRLDPRGSVFIVFRPQAGRAARVAALMEERAATTAPTAAPPPAEIERLADGRLLARRWSGAPLALEMADGRALHLPAAEVPPPIEIRGRWTVRFPPNRGAPDAIELEQLASLSVHPEPGVRHFAGTAEYAVEFDAPVGALSPEREWYLDLGDVQVIATPSLNGRRLPTLWKPPFRTRVDGQLTAGRNRLDVRVTTLWPNRMIGDAALPDDIEWRPAHGHEKIPLRWPDWLLRGAPRPSGRVAFCTRSGVYAAGDPLLPSGLLGPVRLVAAARSVLPAVTKEAVAAGTSAR